MLVIDRPTSPSQQKWFGLSLGGLLLCFAAILHWRFSLPWAAGALAVAGFLTAAVYYAVPAVQLKVIVGFRLLTLPIQIVVSFVLLALLYFGVITPIGLCLRLLGRDPLIKAPRRECESYWRPYAARDESDRYFRMY